VKSKTCLLSVVIAKTSFVQNIDFQRPIDVSSCFKYDQKSLERKRSKEQKGPEGKVSSREFLEDFN